MTPYDGPAGDGVLVIVWNVTRVLFMLLLMDQRVAERRAVAIDTRPQRLHALSPPLSEQREINYN